VFWTWDRYRDLGLLILRLGFGLGFLWYHGGPKLFGGPERWSGTGDAIVNFGPASGFVFWGLLAALAESVGGLLFALGLFFRPVCVALTCVMIVATTNHMVTGQGTPSHSFKNAWLFAGLFFVGPGRYSLDEMRKRRRVREADARRDAMAAQAAGGGHVRSE
jgi:putative oxidoreductase